MTVFLYNKAVHQAIGEKRSRRSYDAQDESYNLIFVAGKVLKRRLRVIMWRNIRCWRITYLSFWLLYVVIKKD